MFVNLDAEFIFFFLHNFFFVVIIEILVFKSAVFFLVEFSELTLYVFFIGMFLIFQKTDESRREATLNEPHLF